MFQKKKLTAEPKTKEPATATKVVRNRVIVVADESRFSFSISELSGARSISLFFVGSNFPG